MRDARQEEHIETWGDQKYRRYIRRSKRGSRTGSVDRTGLSVKGRYFGKPFFHHGRSKKAHALAGGSAADKIIVIVPRLDLSIRLGFTGCAIGMEWRTCEKRLKGGSAVVTRRVTQNAMHRHLWARG